MKLTIIDRLYLQSILPQKGKMIEMLLVDSITKAIRFTAIEIAEYELSDTEMGVAFNSLKDEAKPFDFTIAELEVIKQSCQKLDEQGEVMSKMLPLFNKVLNNV